MKLLNLCALIFCSALSASTPYAIVLVHIGDTLPSYLTTCVQQIRLFNSCAVYLIANDGALKKSKSVLERWHIQSVPLEQLIPSQAHKVFTEKTQLLPGFWQYATERFFYLDEFIEQYGLKNVFHLEYDNMLYVELETLFPIFARYYPGIGATFDNDRRCIPGFVFIKNSQASSDFVTFMAQISGQGKNDMETIALYRALYPDRISCLPIIMPEYSNDHKFRSAHGHTMKNSADASHIIEKFESIFDAAALGQYLGGVDPHGGSSRPGFINESCVFNPSLLQYVWIKDQRGRRVPYAYYASKYYRINNLHIHSKKLELFVS